MRPTRPPRPMSMSRVLGVRGTIGGPADGGAEAGPSTGDATGGAGAGPWARVRNPAAPRTPTRLAPTATTLREGCHLAVSAARWRPAPAVAAGVWPASSGVSAIVVDGGGALRRRGPRGRVAGGSAPLASASRRATSAALGRRVGRGRAGCAAGREVTRAAGGLDVSRGDPREHLEGVAPPRRRAGGPRARRRASRRGRTRRRPRWRRPPRASSGAM